MLFGAQPAQQGLRNLRTSGALQAKLNGVGMLDFVEYVARPVVLVCCINLDVPKSAIYEEKRFRRIARMSTCRTTKQGYSRSAETVTHYAEGVVVGRRRAWKSLSKVRVRYSRRFQLVERTNGYGSLYVTYRNSYRIVPLLYLEFNTGKLRLFLPAHVKNPQTSVSPRRTYSFHSRNSTANVRAAKDQCKVVSVAKRTALPWPCRRHPGAHWAT